MSQEIFPRVLFKEIVYKLYSFFNFFIKFTGQAVWFKRCC